MYTCLPGEITDAFMWLKFENIHMYLYIVLPIHTINDIT